MTEAWLLVDERAIRSAADNPNGRQPLSLPPLHKIELLVDPKDFLHQCLVRASEKRGRRLDQFKRDLPSRVQRITTLIDDFSPLRSLPAFQRFEENTRGVIQSLLR